MGRIQQSKTTAKPARLGPSWDGLFQKKEAGRLLASLADQARDIIKGKLKAICEGAFALSEHCEAPVGGKDNAQKMGESSGQRRREKRAAGPAVRQRAAAHAAAGAKLPERRPSPALSSASDTG